MGLPLSDAEQFPTVRSDLGPLLPSGEGLEFRHTTASEASIITGHGEVGYYTKEGEMKFLQNALVIEPHETPGFENTPENAFLEERFGPNYREEIKGKTVVVPYVQAGWGHAFQAYLAASQMAEYGFRTILVDVAEIATNDEQRYFWMKFDMHKAVQKGLPAREFVEAHVRHDSMKNYVRDKLAAAQYLVGEKVYRNMGMNHVEAQDQPSGVIGSLAKSIDKICSLHPEVNAWLLRQTVAVEGKVADKPFEKALVHFLDTFKAAYVVATHSSPARALQGTKYEELVIVAVPDPGYETDPRLLQPMTTNSSETVYGMPTAMVSEMAKKHFHIRPDHLFDIGTLGPRSVEIAKSKWDEKERRILVSTSGNGTHLEYAERAIEDFSEELKKSQTDYRLVIFLGEHSVDDPGVKNVLQKLKERGLVDTEGKLNRNVTVVRTDNLLETAFWKYALKASCHVEIAKPGENPMDAGQVGTVSIGLPAGGPNEFRNLQIAVEDWKSAIPSAWPPEAFNFWTNIRNKIRFKAGSVDGFERPYSNLVEYMNHLFKDNGEEFSILKRKALRGLDSVPHNTAFFLAQWAIAKMIAPESAIFFGGEQMKKSIEEFEKKQKLDFVLRMLGPEWRMARENRDLLQKTLLELAGFKTEKEFVEAVAKETLVVTFLAGSATRWKESAKNTFGRRAKEFYRINIEDPRSLARVDNLLPRSVVNFPFVPIGMYNFFATKGLGQNVIIHDGYVERFQREILSPLGINNAIFRRQEFPNGEKPRGHGDALLQIRDLLAEKKFVITQNGNDPNSRETILLTQMALYVADKYGLGISAIVPTAYMSSPPYRMHLDDQGLPIKFDHAKLMDEEETDEEKRRFGSSNLGINGFVVSDLMKALGQIDDEYHGNYLGFPGHKKGTNELAYDDIWTKLKGLRQLCVAMPDEIRNSAKTLGKIGWFLKSMKKILAANGTLREDLV